MLLMQRCQTAALFLWRPTENLIRGKWHVE